MATQKPVALVPMDKVSICKILNQKLQIGLTQDTLITPTHEIAQLMYMNFVRSLLNVSESCLSTLPLSATCDHDPELHRRSIPIIIAYQCMKAFIKDHFGDKLDFQMCDLVYPQKTPGRFKRIAGFLADYIRFHEKGLPVFNEVSEEFSYQKQEVELLQEELLEEEKRKNALLAQQNQRKRREHELINEHNKANAELNGKIAQYEASTANAEVLEKEKLEAMDAVDRMENEIISCRKMVDHLKEEVLSSPEELKREMALRKKQIEELKECLNGAKMSLAERLEAIEICTSFEKYKPTVDEKMRQFAAMKEEIIQLFDAVHENQRVLSDLEDEKKFTEEKRKNVIEVLGENAHNHAELREKHLQRIEELNRKIEEIMQQIADLGKNQPDVSRDIGKKRQKLLSVKNATSELVAMFEQEIRETLTKFQKVLAMFQSVSRGADEKRVAFDRAKSRVVNSCNGQLRTDYTFSTSSIADDENTAPDAIVDGDFEVFK